MAAKKSAGSTISGQARAAAGGSDTRERVRELVVKALRDRDVSREELSSVVHDVLHGASEAVDDAVPASRENVLRKVFDGLGDAMGTVKQAGERAVKSAKQRGRSMGEANEDLLKAVSSFADRTTSEVGDELRSMVERARATSGEVGQKARRTAKATEGHLGELAGETMRAGANVARRAAGEMSMAASGLLQGLGEVMRPKPAAKKTAKKAPVKKASAKKAAKKTGKKAKRK